MGLFLYFSIVPLLVTGGMAWLVSVRPSYLEERTVAVVLWLWCGLPTLGLLKAGGQSSGSALAIVGLVSAIGFFFPKIADGALRLIFKDPAEAP